MAWLSNPNKCLPTSDLTARGLTRRPWVKTSLAPGFKAVQRCLEDADLLKGLEQLGFGIVGFACTNCNGMSGALVPAIQQEIIDRDLYTTAVLSGNRNFDGRIHRIPSKPCWRPKKTSTLTPRTGATI